MILGRTWYAWGFGISIFIKSLWYNLMVLKRYKTSPSDHGQDTYRWHWEFCIIYFWMRKIKKNICVSWRKKIGYMGIQNFKKKILFSYVIQHEDLALTSMVQKCQINKIWVSMVGRNTGTLFFDLFCFVCLFLFLFCFFVCGGGGLI